MFKFLKDLLFTDYIKAAEELLARLEAEDKQQQKLMDEVLEND